MKLTDKNGLQHYLEDIAEKLSGKSRLNHKHSAINGLSVVVSDTAPTVDDESVITLVVDSEYVPEITSFDIEVDYDIHRALFVSFLGIRDQTYHVQAVENGAPVQALYQFEQNDGTVLRQYSNSGTFRPTGSTLGVALGVTVNVRVNVDGEERLFKLNGGNLAEAPNLLTSGVNYGGSRVSSLYYEDASDGYSVEFGYASGVDATSYSSIEVRRLTADPVFSTSEELLDAFEEVSYESYPVVYETGKAVAYINDRHYTAENIGDEEIYIVKAVTSGGTVIYFMADFKIKDVPATDSIRNHLTRLGVKPSYSAPASDDNIIGLGSSYASAYPCIEVDTELAYDVTVTIEHDVGHWSTSPFVLNAGDKSTYLSASMWRTWNKEKPVINGKHRVRFTLSGGGFTEIYDVDVYIANTVEEALALRDTVYPEANWDINHKYWQSNPSIVDLTNNIPHVYSIATGSYYDSSNDTVGYAFYVGDTSNSSSTRSIRIFDNDTDREMFELYGASQLTSGQTDMNYTVKQTRFWIAGNTSATGFVPNWTEEDIGTKTLRIEVICDGEKSIGYVKFEVTA